MMIFRMVFTVVILLAGIMASAQSSSQFTGQGQAVIVGGDQARAQQIALNAARTQGLNQAMEYYVSTGGVDRHQYNIKKGELLGNTRDFIVSERLLSASVQDVMLKLSLLIEVDMKSLGQSLGMAGIATRKQQQQKNRYKPGVMVIVAEEINGSINSFPYSVVVIQQKFQDQDYPLVDQTTASRSAKHDQAVQAMVNNNVNSARLIALQFDAGLMVSGRAAVQKSSLQGGGMSAYAANIALNAIAADTGRVLATATASGNYPHVNALVGSRLAIEEASGKATDQLLEKLATQQLQSGTELRLTVSGVNYQQLSILKKILRKEFSQVLEIDTRGFAGNVARLDVALNGSVSGFSEALASKHFGEFRLRVLSQSNEKLDTALVKN